jgi:hypothetical protein
VSLSLSHTICQVLDTLLSAIRKLQPPEKVVVVSNFTTTLDAIEVVLTADISIHNSSLVRVNMTETIIHPFSSSIKP